MNSASVLLENIEKDITDVTAEANIARDNLLSASDPQQELKWKKIWQRLLGQVENLLAVKKC